MQNTVFDFIIVLSLFSLSTLVTVAYYIWAVPKLKRNTSQFKQERISSLKSLMGFRDVKVDGADKIMRRLTADFHETNNRFMHSRDKVVATLTALTTATVFLLIFTSILLIGILDTLLV